MCEQYVLEIEKYKYEWYTKNISENIYNKLKEWLSFGEGSGN